MTRLQHQLLAEELASTEFAIGDVIPVSARWQAPPEFAIGDVIPVSARETEVKPRQRRSKPSRHINPP
jgi:hypothetical protein